MEKIILKQDIQDKIISLFKGEKFTDKEFDLILKYHLSSNGNLPEKEKKILEKLYLRQIEKTDLSFLKDKNITTLVSCVSFSSNENAIYEELPIFKSLRVFKNISKIYLAYTKESKDNYEEIEKELKNKKIEVIGKEIKNDKIKDIYDYIRNLVIKEIINKENTILDVTLGLKMSGIALYKISAEYGITSINWKELQLPIYEKTENGYAEIKKIKRVPFTTQMTIMEEPLKESAKNYENLNNALEKDEYNLVSEYYKNLGMLDLEFFFEELDKVLDFDTMSCLKTEKFYERVRVFLMNVLSYENFTETTKKKIKDFVCTLLTIITFDGDESGLRVNKYSWFKIPNSLNIKYRDIVSKKYDLEKDCGLNDEDVEPEDVFIYNDDKFIKKTKSFMDRELRDFGEEGNEKMDLSKILIYRDEIYFYLVLKYFYKKINKDTKNTLFLFIKREISKEVSKDLKNKKTLNDTATILFDGNDFLEFLSVFDLSKDFKEKLYSSITFKDNILKIYKYGITIDFTKEEDFICRMVNKENQGILGKKNKLLAVASPLEHIFKKGNMILEEEEIMNIYSENAGKKSKEFLEKTFSKTISKFNTKVVKPLNKIIRRELEKEGKESKNFIIYKTIYGKKRIEINKDFYTIV